MQGHWAALYFQGYKYGIPHSYRNWYLPRKRSCSGKRDAKLPFRDSFKAVNPHSHTWPDRAGSAYYHCSACHCHFWQWQKHHKVHFCPLTALQCWVYLSEEHIRPKIKGKMFPRGETISCKWEAEHHRWPCPNFSRHSTQCSEEDKQGTVSQETGSAAPSATVSVWPQAWFTAILIWCYKVL